MLHTFSKTGDMFQLDILVNNKINSPKEIFSSGKYSCCSVINEPAINVSNDLLNDQFFLEEMLTVYQNLIKPFQKKNGTMQESNVYETLCRCYAELMYFNVLNVISLWDYFNHMGEAYEVTIVANIEEYTTVYKYYLNAVCNVISLNGFMHIAKIIEVPHVVTNWFIDNLKDNDVKKNNNEIVITMALQHPLCKLNR